jgi:hypothetical protein
MVKFCQKSNSCRDVQSAQNSWFSPPIDFPTAVTRKSLTIWSLLMDHWKLGRISYQNSLQDFRSFGPSETQMWRSVWPLFCPETEFSSDVDRQKSVTSKLLLGSGWISNRWKAGRVFQRFGIQPMGRIPSKQPHNLIFFRCCNLTRNAVFSKTGHRSKIIRPRPSTVWARVNDRWKPGRVLFSFCGQLWVKYSVEQFRCQLSLILLLIEAKQS